MGVFIDHKKIEEVENFTYLGSSINNTGDIDHELKCQIGKAAMTFNQLKNMEQQVILFENKVEIL